MMRAISLRAPGEVEIVEVAEPTLGPEEVLVRVGCVGLCGSDLNAYRGSSPMVSYPRIIGHEVGGTIVARGEGVPDRVRIGANVTVWPYSHCGACPACRVGRINSCQFNQTLGVQRDGALTERIAVHHGKVYASETLSLRELALVEPLSVGYHAANVGRICETDTALVLGCGAVGLGAVAAAARKGATVIGLDIDGAKLETARKLGARHCVNAATDNAAERIAGLTGGEGVSAAIEAVGAAQTYRMALELVATAGRVVCIGYADQPVELDTKLIVRKELEVLGSRNALHEFRAVVQMLEERARPFTDMISRVVPFDQAAQAFSEWSASPQSFTRLLVQVGEQ
jgi:threonine dehydrogenase-like Zn-dependent dehydrogenase